MDRIKTENQYDIIDDIPIEYVTPNELQHNSSKNRTSHAVIVPKCDLNFDNSLDISSCEPKIFERCDYPKSEPIIIESYDGTSKFDLEMEDSVNGLEPIILERHDYPKYPVPSTNGKKCCEICKTFGVKRVIPVDRQMKELCNVCQECSSNYLPTVALTKLGTCRICQNFDVKTPLNGRKNEIVGLCSSCSSRFLPKVFLKPLETPRPRFQCYVCKVTFDHLETLGQHMKEHNAMMTTAVQNATTKKFVRSKNANLRLHQHNDESPKIKRHSCNQCDYATVFISNLIRHYRKHNDVIKVKVQKFECNDCGKKFAENRSLVDHERIHWDEDERQKLKSKYKCDVCEYSTLWESRLKIHLQIHAAEKPFECDVCSKRFYRKNILKMHEQTHRNDKLFECNICYKKYRLKTGLTYHMKASHVDKALRKYTCYICKYNSMSLAYLRIHMRCHTGVRPFQCRFCPRRFVLKYPCTIHEKTHTEQKHFFKCEICSKNLASKSGLRSHMETHLLESQRIKKFKCNECDSRFYKEKSLLYHHQSKHNVKQEHVRHVCQKCSKEFRTSRSLKVHMTIHSKYTFDCHYCVRHFSSAEKLELHENAKHKIAKFGRKKFECYVCRMPEKNRWKLQHHLRKHFGDRPFRCDVCSQGFMLKSILQRHQRSHWSVEDKRKLKKYKCHVCGYKSATRQRLDVHLERHIKGPFPCPICSKEFPTEGRLSYHQRAHTGAYRNKYICYICNYVGVDFTRIQEHITFKHSNDKPFRCETCHKFFKREKTLKMHQVTHLNKTELDKLKKLKCHLCDYATRNSHNLKRHIFTHTGGVKNASCTKCPMKFSNKTELKAHMLTHLDDSQRIKAFKCNFCAFASAMSNNLKRHIASKHSDTKPFACDQCPQKYSDPAAMKKHLRAHIETPHFCTQCTRKFAQKSDLTKHTASHKSKRFSCKLCKNKYTMNNHLKRHMYSAHSGPSPSSLPCTKCTKTFMDKSALNRHLRTHDSGPKYRSYECYICQYSANVVYKLKQHLSQH